MRVDSEEKTYKNLKNRIKLLSRGIVFSDDSTPVVHLQSVYGGAGPLGETYYVGDAPGNYHSQISLVMYPKEHYLAQYALPAKWREESKTICTEDNIFLEKVPFNWRKGLFRRRRTACFVRPHLHSYGTFAMSFYRWCSHLDQNEGCKFCTISLMVDRYNLSKRMSNRAYVKYLKSGMSYNPVRSVTLTGGVLGTPDDTLKEMLSLARLIRKKTKLSVHVQSEPVFDKALLKELSEVADSIGIFLESFDEKTRRHICPGKARAFNQADYMRSWEMAVSCFGKGKVGTTNIIGFDEDFETILKGVDQAAKIGVCTAILLVRVGSSALGDHIPSYLGREDKVLQLHQELGKILVKNSVDNTSLKNSGCMGCHGCNATKEAVMWARAALGSDNRD